MMGSSLRVMVVYSYGYSYGSVELWADGTWYDVESSLRVIIVMVIVMAVLSYELTAPGMLRESLCQLL